MANAMFSSIETCYDNLVANSNPIEGAQPTNNEFHPVSQEEILVLEGGLGFSIPGQLREFYLRVGWGFLNFDRSGRRETTFPNHFIPPDRVLNFWDRSEVCYEFDKDLIDNGELVFFDFGSYSHLVLRPFSDQPNAVYYPGDKIPVAKDFHSFVLRLYESTTFYLDHESDFSE